MKGIPRKYVIKMAMIEVAGSSMLVYYFKDINDNDLVEAFEHFMEREDYEYCEELAAEMRVRGIDIRKLRNSRW